MEAVMEGTDVVTRARARKVVLPASLLRLSGVALAVDEALLPHSLRSSCLALQGVSSPTPTVVPRNYRLGRATGMEESFLACR